MQRILIQKITRQGQRTGIVQILLSRRRVALERVNNSGLALIERLFAGFLERKVDQHFVVGRGLNAEIVQARPIHGGANRLIVRGMRELDLDQRAAAEVNAQRVCHARTASKTRPPD